MPQALINTEADLKAAIARLRVLDPRFDPIVALTGMPPLRRRGGGFAGLVSIVVSQQLSTASAGAIWGRLIAQQAGQIAYSIIDARSIRLFMPSIFPAVEAPTIGELASRLGLDPAALEATVNEFNAAVRPGTFDHTVLDDCATSGLAIPKSHWARRIEEPPFYGYPLRCGITFTYLGVRVNPQARMLMKDGTPTANMFAAGEIMAGNVLGKGYLAGIGMTIGTVFGRIAGEGAATHANN